MLEKQGRANKWCTPIDSHIWPGRPARTYIQQLCEDTGCGPEDLPETMNDREKWRERVRDIRANGTTWWWWWCVLENGHPSKYLTNSLLFNFCDLIKIYITLLSLAHGWLILTATQHISGYFMSKGMWISLFIVRSYLPVVNQMKMYSTLSRTEASLSDAV